MSARTPPRPALREDPIRPPAESGFTMVEVLVYSILSILVLTIIGGLVVNSIRSQSVIQAVTQATNVSQSAIQAIQRDVRNAVAFEVEAVGSQDALVLAKVATGSGSDDFECVAWYYSAESRELRTERHSLAIALPTLTQLQDWTLVASDVDVPEGAAVFAGGSGRLAVNFDVDAFGASPVQIRTTVVSRIESLEGDPCL